MSKRRETLRNLRAELKALLDEMAGNYPNSIVETVIAPVPPVIVAAMERAHAKTSPGQADALVAWGDVVGDGKIRVFGIVDYGAAILGGANRSSPQNSEGVEP